MKTQNAEFRPTEILDDFCQWLANYITNDEVKNPFGHTCHVDRHALTIGFSCNGERTAWLPQEDFRKLYPLFFEVMASFPPAQNI